MAKQAPEYPFSCPSCRSIKHIVEDEDERTHERDAYHESWQCDNCGTKWFCEFSLTHVEIQLVDEDAPDEDVECKFDTSDTEW